MRALNVGLFSCVGMLLVGGAVFAVTPTGGFGAVPSKDSVASSDGASDDSRAGGTDEQRASGAPSSTFRVGSAVVLEGRLGNSTLLADNPDETYVMLEVRGDEKASGAPPTAALSMVIDKSGSMRGTRFANALQAAATAVERLRDGDSVSVVAFDTRSEKVVPLTTVTPSSRQNIVQSIRNIQLGGDTCISCGIEDGLADLRTASFAGGSTVQRMIVLSDGDANNGIRDIPGFKSLGQRAMSSGVNITTIGVDVDFNEKFMSALSSSSNGRHYFVENDSDLVRVFEAEAASISDSVANAAVAEIELAQGVELVRVFDRTFSRSGSRISIPLGAIAKGETKTVLVKVRVAKGQAQGSTPIAGAELAFRDLTTEKDARVSGKLELELVDRSRGTSALDSIVLDRVQRSETGAALRDANSLFQLGKVDEARKRLETQRQAIASAKPIAANAAPKGRADGLNESFEKQDAELNRSLGNFNQPAASPAEPGAAPPAPARAQKAQVKRNVEQADAFAE